MDDGLMLYRVLENRAIEARMGGDAAGADLIQAEANGLLRSLHRRSLGLVKRQVDAAVEATPLPQPRPEEEPAA